MSNFTALQDEQNRICVEMAKAAGVDPVEALLGMFDHHNMVARGQAIDEQIKAAKGSPRWLL